MALDLREVKAKEFFFVFLVQHFSEMGERKKKKRQRGQRGLVRKEII